MSKRDQDESWKQVWEMMIITDPLNFHIHLQQQTYKLEIAPNEAVESGILFTWKSL